jgi:DNA-directed RNA polymerase subunit RPC12/RpoP
MSFRKQKQQPSSEQASSEVLEEEQDGGFLKNLSAEELHALEERKAKAAQAIIAARERAAIAKAKEAFEHKKHIWKKQKAYVKGSKVCEANRIYEEGGWYICEVCNKKLQDIEWVEEHVNTDKHKRNMEWYASHPIVKEDESSSSQHMNEKEIQDDEFVVWDQEEMIYRCTLCSAKAASEVVLQAHLSGKEHTKRLSNKAWYTEKPAGGSISNLSTGIIAPAYCEWIASEARYVCLWCEKKADSVEMLTVHLEGNEHSKKCANIGIPSFGEPRHMEEAKKYFDQYGANLWARQAEWPDFLVDQATCWNCTMCKKKFLTPVSVNEHLKDKHSGRKCVEKAIMSSASSTSRQRPAAPLRFPFAELVRIDYEGEFECNVCYIPFPTQEDLERHEALDTGHQQVLQKLRENAPTLKNIDNQQTVAENTPPLIELDI